MTDEIEQAMPEVEPVPVEAPPEPVTAPEPVVTPDDAGEPEDKPKGGFQRRIKELADERSYWREMAMRQAPPEPKPPEPTAEPVKLPKLEDFAYDESAYQAALIQHATQLARAEVRKELDADRAQSAEQKRLTTFQERQTAFAKATPDFEDKVMRDPTLPISSAMRDVIVDSDTGPEIAYWLANNREQAEKIARLPPHLAAVELGRVEGRMQAIKEAKSRPVPAVSQAPPPAPTIEANESAPERDLETMSMNDFIKLREKQLRKRTK